MSRIFFAGRLALPLFLLLSMTLPGGAGESTPAPATDYRSSVEQETFGLINQYRRDNKMPPLRWDAEIARVARVHSRDMAMKEVGFGHDGFDGRVDKLKSIKVGFGGAGENVLRTDDPDQLAQRAVALWLKSPAHLHNIRGDYNYSGLGIWIDKDGGIYFTQLFFKFQPRAEAAQAEPKPEPKVESPFGLLAPPSTRRPADGN